MSWVEATGTRGSCLPRPAWIGSRDLSRVLCGVVSQLLYFFPEAGLCKCCGSTLIKVLMVGSEGADIVSGAF